MIISCPSCQRVLHVPDDAAHQPGLCPVCGTRMRVPGQTELARPYEHGQETSEMAFAEEWTPPTLPVIEDDPPPQRLQPGTKVAIGIIGGCLLFGCCAGISLLPHPSKPTSSAVVSKSGKPAEKDPYTPDCAIVRAYLKEHYGEVEIVSWGKRTIWNNRELGGQVFLYANFRRQGDRHIIKGRFTIDGFDTVSDLVIDESR